MGQNTWWLWTITQGVLSLGPLITCQRPLYQIISQAYLQNTAYHLSSWLNLEASSLARNSRTSANRVASFYLLVLPTTMKQRAYQVRQIIKLLLPSSPYGKKQLKVSSVLVPSFGCTKSLSSMIICHHLTSFCLAEGQRQSFQAVIPVYNHRILSKIITEKPISGNKQSSQVSTRGNKLW